MCEWRGVEREREWKERKQACHVHKSDREIQLRWRRQGRRGTTVYICIANAYYSIKIALLRVLNWSRQLSETRTRAHTHTHTRTHTGPCVRPQAHAHAINVTAEARGICTLIQSGTHWMDMWIWPVVVVGVRALAGPLIQLQSRCHSKTHINVSYKLW